MSQNVIVVNPCKGVVSMVDVLGCFIAGSYYKDKLFLLHEVLHLCEATFLCEANRAPKCNVGVWVESPFRKCRLQILWCFNTSSSVRFKATNHFCPFTVSDFGGILCIETLLPFLAVCLQIKQVDSIIL